MKRLFTTQRALVTIFLSAGACLAGACVSDPPLDLPSSDAGGLDATFDSGGSVDPQPNEDAGDDLDATVVVTDGGDYPDFPDDDAGDEDAGPPDAGVGCAALTPGEFYDSTCSSKIAPLKGGNLVSGTYQLYKIDVIGDAAFCRGFTVYQHRGALEVTATSADRDLQYIDQYRPKDDIIIRRPVTVRYDVEVAAKGEALAYTGSAACPGNATRPRSAQFETGMISGKNAIVLLLPYGRSGQALHYFIEP